MILLLINNKPYHYEILETIIKFYYKILNINKPNKEPRIFLEIKNNSIFSSYITTKYPNVEINKHIFFGYDYLINCSVYSLDFEIVRKCLCENTKNNIHYICHDVSYEMKALRNVHYITPLHNNNNFYCDLLPYCDMPKHKTDNPVYIIQGEMTMFRRDYNLLRIILNGKYEYPYKFVILGKGPPCKKLLELYKEYQDKIELKCDLTFLDYHREFLSCYCLFPCISNEKNTMYYRNKLTSSINYARGYNLSILLDYELQSIYHCKKAYVYKNNDKLQKYFNKTLEDFYKPSLFSCFK